MHLIRGNSIGTHLENVDAIPCNGSSLLAEEMVYLLEVGVDSNIVVIVCRKWLGRRESQEDRYSIVHGELRIRVWWVSLEKRGSRRGRQLRWIRCRRWWWW